MKVPFCDLKKQYKNLTPKISSALKKVCQQGDFILGKELELFEKEFAQFLGVKYAIGVASGTDALFLALKALDIGPKDEVILPANTYIAGALAVYHTGARPVLVDINPQTYNINSEKIEQAITSKTKAIMPVHLYGYPAEMRPILKLAKKYNLKIIEDAAQAHGAEYKGQKVGSFSDLGCFSFYPSKNLGAYGDGGMVATNKKSLAEKIGLLRDYGQKKKNFHLIPGFNSRLDSLQAAILRVKLKYLNQWNHLRKKHAQTYTRLIQDLALTKWVKTPLLGGKACKPVFHLYVIRVPKRNKLRKFLAQKNIETGIHYPQPIHLLKPFDYLGYKKGSFPEAEKASQEILSLPMYPELTLAQIKYVTSGINKFYKI